MIRKKEDSIFPLKPENRQNRYINIETWETAEAKNKEQLVDANHRESNCLLEKSNAFCKISISDNFNLAIIDFRIVSEDL